ncbi:MAG: aminotransferase class I/II-fold pyridoxal phosphate-dependent enzyme, partial [Segetibacter sp.]|nr:aminotransferase class I/II-fold pyridoxal phosphate-dependent enzyme [Segetibacter sp.]
MASSMNRRDWLKTSTMLTGGFTFLSGSLTSLAASAVPETSYAKTLSEAEFQRSVPPQLKARLFANENPFGPSEKAKKAIAEAVSTCYQYPIAEIDKMEEQIMAYEGLQKGMVMMASGSSPILHAAAISFCKLGDSVVSGDPSYADLPEHAEAMKARWIKVPLTSDYKLDLDAMEKAIDNTTKLVYIVNPNNPTATIVDAARLKDFCERVSKKATVFVDEAYIDYLPDPQGTTLIDCVKKGQNVIVARTFSKLYGFAGLRIGYMIAQPETVKKLTPYCTGPFGISAPSIHAALASYQDKEFLQSALQKTVASKEFLYKTLQQEGYEYIPSSANFVMFPIKMDGKRFTDEMMKRGVGVRFWEFNNKQWCRVSVGRM